MIVVGVLDASRLTGTVSLDGLLPKNEIVRIEKCGNELLKKERLGSRLVLAALFRELFDAPLPEICYTGDGKPFFANSAASFSISHSGGVCAVALAKDYSSVGIDIQELPSDPCRLKRALSRFGEGVNSGKKHTEATEPLPLDWSFFCTGAGGIERCEDYLGIALLSIDGEKKEPFVLKELSFAKTADDTAAWCRLEALAKLDGGGLTRDVALPAKRDTRLKTVFLEHGGREFAVCVAANGGAEA